MTNWEIIEIDPSYGFKTREIDLLRQQLLEENYTRENRNVVVHYIYGDSGTGKTRSIFDKHSATDICRITNYPAKGAQVCIADFKCGVDFPPVCPTRCRSI